MNCRRVEELLPLFAGRDLDESMVREVRWHLSDCIGCSRLAAEYEESQDWLGMYQPPEPSEAFFEQIRETVLNRVATGSSGGIGAKPFAWIERVFGGWNGKAVMATAASLALLAALSLYLMNNQEADLNQPRIADRLHPEPGERSEAARPAAAGSLENKLAPRPSTRRRSIRPRRERAAEPVVAQLPDRIPSRSDSDPVVRIEFKTGDPNIRIIWFASSAESD
jgi:hypothetical protein